jgi:hypothetical protein
MANITTLYINSKDLNSGSSTNFEYYLPQGISSLDSFYVKQVSIPYSAYVTVYPDKSNTNSSYVSISDTVGLSNVVLTAGNYSAPALAGALQTALNSSPGSRNTTYTVTYSSIEDKYTISSTSGNFIIYWVTGMNNNGQQLYRTFGFTSANSTGASSYTSINAAVVSGTSLNYYIKSNTFTLDGSYSYFQGVKDTVICQVPINVNPDGIIEYINFNPDLIPLKMMTMTNVNLQLVDEWGNEPLLNGLDWTLTLIFYNKDRL